MEVALAKTKTLMEALPWIKAHHGRTVVIKYGGNAMINDDLKESIASDVVLMKYVGINPIVVHGGGPTITEHMKKAGKEAKFVDGLRITDKDTMGLVKEVLVEKVNSEVVGLINEHTVTDGKRASLVPEKDELAMGLSGDDDKLIVVEKFAHDRHDLGFVGTVKEIDNQKLEALIEKGVTPVIASIGVGSDGESYNINADQVAGHVAAALNADKIIFLTDVEGLYRDFEDKSSLISELSLRECEKMVAEKHISRGMLPKVKGCITALDGGASQAHILDGTISHALLLEIFTDKGVGTMVTKQIKD